MHLLKTTLLFLLLLWLTCCQTNQYKDKQKNGRWVYRDTVNGILHESKGKYKKGLEKKTWKYYANNKLLKTETYKKNSCHVITYHDNGIKASEGNTKLVTTDTETHWYYFNEWQFYDQTGKLVKRKKYADGTLLEETKVE